MSAVIAAPERKHGFCSLCIARCGTVATVEDGRFIRLDPDPNHPTGTAICAKGRAAPELTYHKERLTRPLRRKNPKGSIDPGWEEISWDAALDEIATAMRRAADEFGPQSVAFSQSSTSTTAIADSAALGIRLMNAFGTPNLVTGLELCGWGRGFATRYVYGVGSVATGRSGAMADIGQSGCLILWGYNPSISRITHATATVAGLKRGMKLIVIDPRNAGLTNKADQWLRVRPGTDGALALGLANIMIERGWYDRRFIQEWTNGPLLVRDDTGRLLRASDVSGAGQADGYFAWDPKSRELVAYDAKKGCYDKSSVLMALEGDCRIETRQGPVVCRPVFDHYASWNKPKAAYHQNRLELAMKRREFIGLIGGAAAWPRTTRGQQVVNPPLVAVIAMATAQIANARSADIREGLKRAGLIEGKDYIMTVRFAEGDNARLLEIVRDLDRLKPRVYVTVANGPQPIHKLAPKVPVVFTAIAIDPVAYGWVESYAKPGGMTTGNVQNALGGLESLTSKQFQLFKELVPNLTRLGFIGLMDTAVQFPVEHASVQKAAQQLGFAVSMYEVPTLDDVESAIASAQRDEVSAFFVSISPRLVARIPQIVAALAKTGKPALGPTAVWARGGLLMSYSTDFDEQARRAGGQVAQILKGANPGDLPIEQADKFTLILNLKTAKQLGITVPPALLAQADELIE